MYRVLLSRTGVAYAKECDDELDEFDFILEHSNKKAA